MDDRNVSHIQLVTKDGVRDVTGERIEHEARRYLGIDTGRVRSTKVFSVLLPLSEEQLVTFAEEGLRDELLHEVHVGRLWDAHNSASYISVGKLPGVTDDEGASAEKMLRDLLDLPPEQGVQRIFTRDLFLLEANLDRTALKGIAEELLGNVLIHHLELGDVAEISDYVPEVRLESEAETETVDIFVTDEELLQLSKERVLSLSLEEMKVIQSHYRDPATEERRRKHGLSGAPTDCELEVLAQTWSEHCKHKEFNAVIHYRDADTGEETTIDSLFGTYIRGATEVIGERLAESGCDWLVKVFSDNAGVVRIDDHRLFVFKVETHNTPSALDPYGGAITGILGNNRDPLGTGRGGGRLLFNTNVLCFGPPDYDKPLLTGQLHPKRVFSGVREGIEDGGNKSGVPTVNGSVIFDERYSGKPLVYCGTGSIMPAYYKGKASWEKEIDPGDVIFMAGGRVGKDGIHGATFSSAEIDKHSPRSAVQIGSPITQKLVTDFLEVACARGLIKCTTDNGAGGLSSSVGELAPISGGARVNLETVPLKYQGLAPWEIFVSESQERMTLVVEPDRVEEVRILAAKHEVELSEVGVFTNSGDLEVYFGDRLVALLDIDFLHDGVPRKTLHAEWRTPGAAEPKLPTDLDHRETLLRLLASPDICSREAVVRQYDHEVKGKTVVKPLMGPDGIAPQDAAVLRLDHEGWRGVAVSNGIFPRYGDLDAYEMSAGAFDEAVRQIIAVGGRLPDTNDPEAPFWSACDNFCVPDSAYDPESNPDGKYKLAQLVRMCRALYDMSTTFDIPMTSGKDSMKNDFRADGVKISVPPTILYSMVAGVEDVRRSVTSYFKESGDLVYLLGETYDELGGSELYRLLGEVGANVPRVRRADALRLYRKVMAANEERLIESCHDLSDGGLAVALAECCFGGARGANIELPTSDLSLNAALYSESHSRFVASVRRENRERFEELLGDDGTLLGQVTGGSRVQVSWHGDVVMDTSLDELVEAWSNGLDL